MRRALVALAVAGLFIFTTTPASACSIPPAPLSISPVVGGAGTRIRAEGYCEGDVSVTLGWPERSAGRPPVDVVTVHGNGGSFAVTLKNAYAPPHPPGARYFYDMEVSSRCDGATAGRVPFLAADPIAYARTHIFTVPGDGPTNARTFDERGSPGYALNSYVRTQGAGGTVAVVSASPNDYHDRLVVGSGPGTDAVFSLVGAFGGAAAYPSFRGGVNVATGDVDGDGDADIITGAGPGGGPHVKVWKVVPGDPNLPACGPLFESSAGWYAYDPAFAGGVSVAAADLDGDGRAEIITGALAGGGPHVRIFDEAGRLKTEFMAYDPNFYGGVHVAAADLLGNSRAEIVTGAGPGGGPHVRVFDVNANPLTGFYAYAPEWTGGIHVAAGRPNQDSPKAMIVTGTGAGGGPHVRVLDANGVGPSGFFAYEGVTGGVRVAAAP